MARKTREIDRTRNQDSRCETFCETAELYESVLILNSDQKDLKPVGSEKSASTRNATDALAHIFRRMQLVRDAQGM